MDRGKKEQVWKAFWNRQRSARSPSVVSTEWDAVSKAQFEAWTDFAEPLPEFARVIDFATGAGKVLLMLNETRPDLELTGIDIADPLPDAPEGIELRGGLNMENLPFEDDRFDVAVSQFGFEYGNLEATSSEMLRVLAPGGRIGLMVHRGDGPILAHNLRREEQIRWVKQDMGLFPSDRDLLRPGTEVSSGAVELATSIAKEGLERFGRGNVAWEIPEAVRQTLLLAPRGTHEKLLETLSLIDEQSEHELGRIQSLREACEVADNRDRLLKGFRAAGRDVISVIPVRIGNDPPFADLIEI